MATIVGMFLATHESVAHGQRQENADRENTNQIAGFVTLPSKKKIKNGNNNNYFLSTISTNLQIVLNEVA